MTIAGNYFFPAVPTLSAEAFGEGGQNNRNFSGLKRGFDPGPG